MIARKTRYLPGRLALWVALIGGMMGVAVGQNTVGILEFEEMNAPGLGKRVRDTLTKSFRDAGFSVVGEGTIDSAAKAIPGAPQLDSGGAKRLGQQTGVKWVVTGRVVGGPVTFVVAKVLSTSSDEVTGDARQVRDPSEMEAALLDLGAKLVKNLQ